MTLPYIYPDSGYICRIVQCIEAGSDTIGDAKGKERGVDNENEVQLELSDDQSRALQRHRQALQRSFEETNVDTAATAAAAVHSATQWSNEFFHLAASTSSDGPSLSSEVGTNTATGGLVLLRPHLLRASAAWAWLIEGAHPAAAAAAVPSSLPALATWVDRSRQVSSKQQQLGLEAAAEKERQVVQRAAEEATAHAGETRALKTRLNELDRLLRSAGSSSSSSNKQPAGGEMDESVAAKLTKENQVSLSSFNLTILIFYICCVCLPN